MAEVFFSQQGFFCRNILTFGSLPTAVVNSDEILTVTHLPNDLLSCVDRRPRIYLTCLIFLQCRMFFLPENYKGKNCEKRTFRSTSGTFFHFDDSCWLNTVRMPSDRGSKNNWLFWLLPIYFGFFSDEFWRFFRFFLQILGHLQKTFFYKRLFLWSQERYRYIFVVDIDASARQNIFRKNRLIFFGCRKKLKTWFFRRANGTFFILRSSCWMTYLVLLSDRWNND